MKESSRLKAMDERTSHVTEWKATKRTNESSEWTNEQDNVRMNERTNKPDNRTSEMPAKQTENGPIARTNARKPGDSTNGWIHLSFLKTRKNSASMVQNIEKYFWAALNKISRNWF